MKQFRELPWFIFFQLVSEFNIPQPFWMFRMNCFQFFIFISKLSLFQNKSGIKKAALEKHSCSSWLGLIICFSKTLVSGKMLFWLGSAIKIVSISWNCSRSTPPYQYESGKWHYPAFLLFHGDHINQEFEEILVAAWDCGKFTSCMAFQVIYSS